MSEITATGPVAPARGTGTALIRSGADLVELTERLYLRLFRLTLGLVVGAAVLCVALAAIQHRDWHGGLTAALAIVVALTAGSIRRFGAPAVYFALRRTPWRRTIPGALAAVLLVADGPYGPLWFIAMACILVMAVLASRRATITAGVVAALAYVAGTALHGAAFSAGDATHLGAATGIAIDGALGAAAVNWLARFVMRLHQIQQGPAGRPTPRFVTALTDPPKGARRRAPRLLPPGPSRLTARQLQVAVLLRDGLKQGEIAACLGITARQVERLVGQARQRTGAATPSQLVAMLVGGRLVPPTADAAG